MPKFKKSSGFKMKGYSYTGKSPVKKLEDPSIDIENIDKEVEREKKIEETEGLTDEQKKELFGERKDSMDKSARAADKRRADHTAKMDFRYQRSKFSGGEVPDVYNPSGLPS